MRQDLTHLAQKKKIVSTPCTISVSQCGLFALLLLQGRDALAKAKEGQREAILRKKKVPTGQTPGVVIPSQRNRTFHVCH